MNDFTISAEAISRIVLAIRVLTDVAILMVITSVVTAAIVHHSHTSD